MSATATLRERAKRDRTRARGSVLTECERVFGPAAGWDAQLATWVAAVLDSTDTRALNATASILANTVRRDP